MEKIYFVATEEFPGNWALGGTARTVLTGLTKSDVEKRVRTVARLHKQPVTVEWQPLFQEEYVSTVDLEKEEECHAE